MTSLTYNDKQLIPLLREMLPRLPQTPWANVVPVLSRNYGDRNIKLNGESSIPPDGTLAIFPSGDFELTDKRLFCTASAREFDPAMIDQRNDELRHMAAIMNSVHDDCATPVKLFKTVEASILKQNPGMESYTYQTMGWVPYEHQIHTFALPAAMKGDVLETYNEGKTPIDPDKSFLVYVSNRVGERCFVMDKANVAMMAPIWGKDFGSPSDFLAKMPTLLRSQIASAARTPK